MCNAPDCHHRPTTPQNRTRNWSGPFPKTPTRLLGMGFIRLYQLTLSSLIGNSCRHYPTCSEFGYEAVARHGLWAGFWHLRHRPGARGAGQPDALVSAVALLAAQAGVNACNQVALNASVQMGSSKGSGCSKALLL